MKNINTICILFVLLMVSCTEKERNIPVFVYALEKNEVEKYVLKIHRDKTIINFEYLNLKDSTNKLDFKYVIKKELLKSNFETFFPTNKTYNSKSLKFDMFRTKESKKTLFFNKNYGLLASLGLGENFILLKDSISLNTKELIFKELFLELNKININ